MYYQSETERDILLKLRDGSPKAFEALFHKYGGKLYNFIFKLSSGNTYLAEEIVQSTFVRIWETRAFLNPDKSFISYLCTIARNQLINEYEHRMVEYIYREYILKYHSVADNFTEKETDRNLLEEYIDSLIEKLPPARKRVFILSRKEMLSIKEIAERLHISESTVQTQLSKAVSFMKEHLTKYYAHLISIIINICFC
ncbi:RNA polymerase sigma factor [Bacteroidia bacterium]|nr:RNA polymerase sigma factor [Bacteroidia bacterium]